MARTVHGYAKRGLIMRPVWLTTVEVALVRAAAERRALSQQEFARRALLRAAGVRNPPPRQAGRSAAR